jgi:hypothetical protein
MTKTQSPRMLGLEPLERREMLAVDYVIHISVDGLRPDAVASLGPALAPNFFRLRSQGAITDNARTDFDFTVTLPNHTSQLTGRPVQGAGGHNFTANDDIGGTIHDVKGSYVTSAFDVVHDHGLATGLYAGKSKFAIYDRTWDATNGAPDVTGADNGRDKIDNYVFNADLSQLTSRFVSDMTSAPLNYTLLHLADPDPAGHTHGWLSGDYLTAVRAVDAALGGVFNLIDANSTFTGRTAIILTADHGGTAFTHTSASDPANFIIPFYVWGPGVSAGEDLYAINSGDRQIPGITRPNNETTPQPIRAAEAANLALDLLGLPAVPGSQFGAGQDLDVISAGSKWVTNLYDDLLGRAGTNAEILHWKQRLDTGIPRDLVVRQIQQSAEYRSRAIDGFYQSLLGRTLDPAGRQFWLSATAGGLPLENVRRAILVSGEYFARHGANHAGYVAGLYSDLLGRGASSAESDFWQQSLAAGVPRASVVAAFAASPEFYARQVNLAYPQFLNRPADPLGHAWWVNFLADGGTLPRFEQALLASPEYFNR